MDILLNDNNDIAFLNGATLVTTQLRDSVAQRLKVTLQTFTGEWFLDPSLGVDYFNRIFGKGKRKEAVDLLLQSKITDDPDVVRLVSYSSTLYSNRTFEMSFKVQVTDGSVTDTTTIQIEV